MKEYEKPYLIEDEIEIADIIAISNGGSGSAENGEKVPASELW